MENKGEGKIQRKKREKEEGERRHKRREIKETKNKDRCYRMSRRERNIDRLIDKLMD